MNITIKTSKTVPLTKVTQIDDGKNNLVITEKKEGLVTTTSIQSNGNSIYPIMDLLNILEAVD